MSEIRKPIFVFLLKKLSKIDGEKLRVNKVELFDALDFTDKKTIGLRHTESLYRLRVNGKWFPKGKKEFYYKSDIRNMIFKSLRIK